MNESEAKYTREYVELRTTLEHIRTKLEIMDKTIRDIHITQAEYHKQVEKNRNDLAGVKATATLLGGFAGTLFAIVTRMLFSSE